MVWGVREACLFPPYCKQGVAGSSPAGSTEGNTRRHRQFRLTVAFRSGVCLESLGDGTSSRPEAHRRVADGRANAPDP